MKLKQYAMYKGDTYIDQGTIRYLSKKWHRSVRNLRSLASPSRHKNSRGNMTLLYRLEEE